MDIVVKFDNNSNAEMARYVIIVVYVVLATFRVQAQDVTEVKKSLLRVPGEADSTYILRYIREDDIRLIYGGQGSNISYGTLNESNEIFNNSLYNNVNDLVGFGLTYKFIDFDLTFSLPDVHILNEERQNLSQFRLAYSYTMRKLAIRAYISDAKGVIVEDTKGTSQTEPDVHLLKGGAQVTYYFNFNRYSYRAANFQNELQHRSAGSFLIRAEPFYRSLGMETAMVPEAYPYRKQAGLEYVRSGGLLLSPGYGYNLALYRGKIFVSPIIFFGTGFSVNVYKADDGKHTYVNREWGGSLALNIGYNGAKAYATLRGIYEATYFNLNPTYFTTSDLKVTLTIGVRFNHFETFIPSSLF